MKEELAVEWFANRISHGGLVTKKQFNDLLEQAKEMENEKYKYFFECGRNYQLTGEGTFKELYNETFKQQEQ
jgi:hypothetical protein